MQEPTGQHSVSTVLISKNLATSPSDCSFSVNSYPNENVENDITMNHTYVSYFCQETEKIVDD